MQVPLFAPGAAIEPLRARVDDALARVVDRGAYILGPELSAFESEFAAYLGVRHVVGVGNGTDAITLALLALGVGHGDEVVVPSFTFWASAEAIVPTGARPVFCEVDPDTFCVTLETVRAALTPSTRAIVAVDLFGNPAAIDGLRELGVPIVEDAAQAAGARLGERRAGALGTIATFSFYPSKNLACFGDGGAVATDDDALADRLRLLRNHGTTDKDSFSLIGFNSRLDELQAALLRVFLPHLDTWCNARRDVIRSYADLGLGELVTLPVPTPGAQPAWHLYVIRHERRDALAATLRKAGIDCRAYYSTPIHRQPAMANHAVGVELPVTDELARTHLAIPVGPTLTAEQLEAVVTGVAAGVSASAEPGGRSG